NGSKTGDTFILSSDGGSGVSVTAPGTIPVHGSDIQVVNLDGTAGGDTYTVNDLSGTSVQSVTLNFHEAAAHDSTADSVTVNGAMNIPNQVVISAETNQVQQNQGNNLQNVPGSDTVVDVTTVGGGPFGGTTSHYIIRAAIPKMSDTLHVN